MKGYSPIKIAKLSEKQISRLRNGHPVRVKHGDHHTIHVSEEQHKKIHRAHKKGAGCVIQMDPHQAEEHKHMMSHGGKIDWKKVGRTLKKTFAPVVRPILKGIAKQAIPAGLKAFGELTGNPEVSALAPVLQNKTDQGIDKLQKYGFGVKKNMFHHKRKHSLRGSALMPAGY